MSSSKPNSASRQATEIDIYAREILRMREQLNRLLAQHTRQPLAKLEHDVERDFILNAQQAIEYGLIDQVLERRALTASVK